MKISYGRSEDAWHGFEILILSLITKYEIKSICDIGGGANPILNEDSIKKLKINYTILDISEIELQKTSNLFDKILADVSSTNFNINRKFDLVVSKMLAEHIADAEQFHINIRTILNKNGLAIHFFPTLYALPFCLNYLLPNKFSGILLNFVSPRDKFRYPKFPAYYNICKGPIRSQLKILKKFGYDIIEYKAFFGHGYYDNFRILKILHNHIVKLLLKYPINLFSSFSYVILRKSTC